jgi:hypothetical protein
VNKKATHIFIFLIALLPSCSKDSNQIEPRNPDVPGKHFVYIKNYSDRMWIGTNSDSLGGVMSAFTGTGTEYWIGGGVVPDSILRHGFYFDPNTILIAEATVEGMQTTISQIREDPVYYQNNGWSNGLTGHAWYIKAEFLKYKALLIPYY